MTHRVFSRNASSSRAVPVQKVIDRVKRDPAMPLWTYNQPGMQGNMMATADAFQARADWLAARDAAVARAEIMAARERPAHKQVINRILEPYSWIKVIVSSTDWANFMRLRDHSAADPMMRELARKIGTQMFLSTPRKLEPGDWHLPYIDPDKDIHSAAITCLERSPSLGANEDWLQEEIIYMLAAVSTARCARVSYLNHDGSTPRFLKDLELYDDLMSQPKTEPLHASPAEHQAQCDRKIGPSWENPHLHGNFWGWNQFRKTHPNEAVVEPGRT